MSKLVAKTSDFVEQDFFRFNANIYDNKRNNKHNKDFGEFAYCIKLSDPDFVKITNQHEYFGADQAWIDRESLKTAYKSALANKNMDDSKKYTLKKISKKIFSKKNKNYYADRGCGPVAAANILAYYAVVNDTKAIKILYFGKNTGEVKSKDDFLVHLLYVLCCVRPKVFGMPILSEWIESVRETLSVFSDASITKVNKFKMSSLFYSRKKARNRAEAFIQYNLYKNRPVACLHLGLPQRSMLDYNQNDTTKKRHKMTYHWVTITQIMRDAKGVSYVEISSWGKKMIFLLDEFLDGLPSFDSLELK